MLANLGKFRIENRTSNWNLLAGSYGTDSGDHKVWQYPLTELNNDPKNIEGFMWQLKDPATGNVWDGKSDPPTTPQNIINCVSGYALLAGSYGRDTGDHKVWQYPLTELNGDPKNIEGFKWQIVKVTDINFPIDPTTNIVPETPPKLTSLKVPDHLDPFEGQSTYLPCWMVDDTGREFKWQVQNSPYYELKCTHLYKCVGSQLNSTNKAIEQFNLGSIQLGWSKSESISFTQTVGISTTVSASAGVEGISSTSVSATFSFELGFSQSEDITESKEKIYNPVIPYIPPNGVAALYGIQYTFRLRRMDGTLVREWTQWDPLAMNFVNVVFPDN